MAQQQNEPLVGSGVVYKVDGETVYIITNAHNVMNSTMTQVNVDDKPFTASVLDIDASMDIAVLELKVLAEDTDKFVPIEFADSETIKEGAWVLSVGAPYGFNTSASDGIISAFDEAYSMDEAGKQITIDMIETDANINVGSTGGALVNIRILGHHPLPRY